MIATARLCSQAACVCVLAPVFARVPLPLLIYAAPTFLDLFGRRGERERKRMTARRTTKTDPIRLRTSLERSCARYWQASVRRGEADAERWGYNYKVKMGGTATPNTDIDEYIVLFFSWVITHRTVAYTAHTTRAHVPIAPSCVDRARLGSARAVSGERR